MEVDKRVNEFDRRNLETQNKMLQAVEGKLNKTYFCSLPRSLVAMKFLASKYSI